MSLNLTAPFAALLIVPIACRAASIRGVNFGWMIACACLLAVAFALDQGLAAGLLATPWLCFGGTLAARAAGRIRRRRGEESEFLVDLSFLYLAAVRPVAIEVRCASAWVAGRPDSSGRHPLPLRGICGVHVCRSHRPRLGTRPEPHLFPGASLLRSRGCAGVDNRARAARSSRTYDRNCNLRRYRCN